MATNAISEKIQALRSETQPNSISPEMVGSIMQSIVDDLKSVETKAKEKVIVDQSLNKTSKNAISNKAVATALEKLGPSDIDPTIVVTGTNVRLYGEGSSALITIKATFNGQLISDFTSPSDGMASNNPVTLTFENPKIDWGELKPYIKEETKIVDRGVLQIEVTQSKELPEGQTFKMANTQIVIVFHNRPYQHPIFASIDETRDGNGDDPSTYFKMSSVLTFEKFVSGVSPKKISYNGTDGNFVYCSDLNQFAYQTPNGGYFNNGNTAEGFVSGSYCEGYNNKPRKNVIFVCKADNCAYISYDGNTLTKIKNL